MASESSQPATLKLEPGTLPPQITAMLAEITGVLNETFHTYPPHTIQRLAELVLEPRRHYRSLPAYLHAVDRVVHVTSGNNIYPLPPAIPNMSQMNMNGLGDGQESNGTGDGGSESGHAIWASSSNGAPIGSDEALGGALLTPIPWLARRSANGDGGSESSESSTLGSEGGPSPLGPAAAAGTGQSQRQSQSRQFEMQVRTESTETIDGPNGMGSIETVSVVNGISSLSPAQQQRVITQGELIRQEQRAGVVPVSQLTRTGPLVVTSSSGGESSTAASAAVEADTPMGEGEGAAAEPETSESHASKDNSSEKFDEDMPDEEAPHARGPDIIGAADMGPQTPSSSTFSISSGGNVEVRGIDVEAAVGRKNEDQVPRGEGEGDAAAQPESSDGIPTPSSSEPDAATAEQSVTEPGDDASSKEESKEGESQGADDKAKELPEGMDAESSPATKTAPSSPAPGKREAEDDIAETESVSSKRLKGSPGKDAAEEDMLVEASASSTAPEDAQAETEGNDQQIEAQPKKNDDGDIAALSGQTAEAAAAEPANDAGTEKKEEDGTNPREESAD